MMNIILPSWPCPRVRRRLVPSLLAVALLGLEGCAKPKPPGFTVAGRVSSGGEPLPLDPVLAQGAAAFVRVGFIRVGDDGKSVLSSQSVMTTADGTYSAPRLPAGHYRVTVEHFNGGADDLLKGRFLDMNTPIDWDVAGDVASFDIDLAEYAKLKRRKK